MLPTESNANWFYRFFGLSDKNKILALIIVFLGFSVWALCETAKFSLMIIKDSNALIKDDNVRLREENKELKVENFDLLLFKKQHYITKISRLDTIDNDLNAIKKKLKIK